MRKAPSHNSYQSQVLCLFEHPLKHSFHRLETDGKIDLSFEIHLVRGQLSFTALSQIAWTLIDNNHHLPPHFFQLDSDTHSRLYFWCGLDRTGSLAISRRIRTVFHCPTPSNIVSRRPRATCRKSSEALRMSRKGTLACRSRFGMVHTLLYEWVKTINIR